jgi:hypothetical protein
MGPHRPLTRSRGWVSSNGLGQHNPASPPRESTQPSRAGIARQAGASVTAGGSGKTAVFSPLLVWYGWCPGWFEAITCRVANRTQKAILCACEKCGHLWLVPAARGTSARCAKCKRWRWDVVADRKLSPPKPTPQRRAPSRRPPDPEDIELSLPPPCPEAPPLVEMAASEPGRPHNVTVCPRCGMSLINDFAREVHTCRPIGSMLPCHTRTRLMPLPTWTPERPGPARQA